jgi:aspartate--ammonia ligase
MYMQGDVTHSAVADQYDFEIRINKEDRNIEYLKDHVRTIWKVSDATVGLCGVFLG